VWVRRSRVNEKNWVDHNTVLPRPPLACSHISVASSVKSFSSIMSFNIHVETVETSELSGCSAHVVGPVPQRVVSPFAILDSVEDTEIGPHRVNSA